MCKSILGKHQIKLAVLRKYHNNKSISKFYILVWFNSLIHHHGHCCVFWNQGYINFHQSKQILNQTVVWQGLFMPEKALNVRGCGSGPKPKICESEFNAQCLWGSLCLQPVAIPYILSKLYNWTLPLKQNSLLRTRHTGRQQWLTCCNCSCCWFVPPYESMFSPDACHQKLLEIVHREEVKVNWILSAKVEFLNSEKGSRDRYKLQGTRHFTPFKEDARKWRENRENLVSNSESRWSVLVEGRALRML